MLISEVKHDWYLYSVVFDFSPESSEDFKEEEDMLSFRKLHISVVSTQKYRLDHSVDFCNAKLL